jgi:hypothetical protein
MKNVMQLNLIKIHGIKSADLFGFIEVEVYSLKDML